MSLFRELQRRNVIRVAAAYLVAAWLVVQVVETILPVFDFPIESVRLVIIVLAIGFVPAVVLAWIFQITPEGLKLDTDAGVPLPASQQARKRLDRAIIVLLLLGIVYFAVDKFVLAPGRIAEREAEVAALAKEEAVKGFYGDRSIAVIPFDNLSSDPEQQYFADGVAEEVLNLLARIRELRVISRSSAFALRGEVLEIPEIAATLGVAHILEGSVRRAGNRVRVTAQLIEARSDTHLWSQTYDRELENVFAIQDEIAADVARNLQIELLRPLPRSRYVDPEVVALTQQAKQVFHTRPRDTGAKMYVLLSRALEIDPAYVPALKWMAYANAFRAEEGLISGEEMREHYERVKEAILEIEPDSASIDTWRAFDLARAGKLEEAAEFYLQALSKDMSDSEQVRLAGLYARGIGKMEVSRQLLEHTVAIDPLCFQCLYQLARTYMYTGDYELSQEMRERYLAIGSGGHYYHALNLLLQGRAQEALDYLSSLEDNAQAMAGKAMAWYSLGESANAEAELEKLAATDNKERGILMAETAAWMDRKDLAFEWLEKGGPAMWNERLLNPVFENLHDDSRWEPYLASVGHSAARLDAIDFKPVMPE